MEPCPNTRAFATAATLLGLLTTGAGAQRVHVEPRVARLDAPVRIRATGLAAGSGAILRASRPDSAGRLWQAYAGLRADARGTIDLQRMAPVHGSYSGTSPMGLLTSMDVAGEARGRTRYPFGWSDTLRTVITLEVDGKILSADTLVQTAAAPGVERQPVRDSVLVGALFLPPRKTGPDSAGPALLVLGGSEGGLGSEDVAAQLASHGYVTLALAYFGIDPLPSSLDRVPLEYFARAIAFLQDHPRVARARIGIVGTSKGAEAALLIAASSAAIRGVVAYAPSHVVWSCICSGPRASWSRAASDLPFVPAGADPLYRPPPGFPIRPTVNYEHRLRDAAAVDRARIPVERIRGPIMLIAGGDDGLWPSLPMAREVLRRRRRLGGHRADTVRAYPDAGHLIGKSYVPGGTTLVGGGRLETGGSVPANARAQADAWPHVLRFLERSLRDPAAAAVPRGGGAATRPPPPQ